MNRPEILAPAGDFEKLQTAFRYGADACYMGVKTMSMRSKIDDRGGDVLEDALSLKNKLGKKIYLTMNIHAHEYNLAFLEKELQKLTALHKKGLDPDGVLVSDAGVFGVIREKCPWLEIHVSTQANILNSAGIEFWAKQGATRVVLGREVSLHEIKKIKKELKKKKIKVELEAFVHGAMCMAYSGRCLLSSFMTGRDPNQGMCAHSCRWNYKVYLEEELRPGEYIPIEEDQNGTSIMSAKDMCMIEHLKDVLETEIDSLKIEGRHKTVYYTAIVCKAYKQALDLTMKGKKLTPEILELIDSIDTRGYCTGFWYGRPGADGQRYKERNDYNENFCFAGVVRKIEDSEMTVEVRNRLDRGDQLDVITPENIIPITLGKFKNAKNGEIIESASAGQNFSIILEVPKGVKVGDILRKRLKS